MANNSSEVIVRLSGGLGNQLFELSAALSLSPDKIFVDTKKLRNTTRKFELEPLNKFVKFEKKEINIFQRLFYQKIQEEREFNWKKLEMHKKAVVEGYFQHPMYAEFLIEPLSRCVAERLSNHTTCGCRMKHIGIHMRRGDYAEVPVNKKVFGVLSQDYFKSVMAALGTDYHYILFSDSIIHSREIEELRRNYNVDKGEEKLSAFDLLVVFSQFDGLIMSNSSLSWWGASVGQKISSEFKVICPSNWFRRLPESNSLIARSWDLVNPIWQL
jgi:hypothetical protein